METPNSLTKRFQQLRWKLTLSYTGVTVGALLTVELFLLAGTAIVVSFLLNSGFLQADLIKAVSDDVTPRLQFLLSGIPPDQDEITEWLNNIRASIGPTIPLTFNANDQMFIVDQNSVLLGSSPQDILGIDMIGLPIDMQALPGLAAPLQAALAGEEEVDKLYNKPTHGESVILAIPIWNEANERVLGVLVAVGQFPTVQSVLRTMIPIMGISFLFFTLIAGFAGTIYGSIAARGLSSRLDRLSEGPKAWSLGNFTKLVEDSSGDEIGQLASNLNNMARQLEQLLDTRSQLMVVEERNRLARDLHDSAKQQAFAAAAQISAARKLLYKNPEASEASLEEAERLTDALRKELTFLIEELRPAALEDKGLVLAVREYSEDWSRQNGITMLVKAQHERPLPIDIEHTIYRIIQEALANVARHSQASNVEIKLKYEKFGIKCAINDDGQGFNAEQKHAGFGMRSMQERAKAIGSELSIDSGEGKGTCISFLVAIDKLEKMTG